MNEQHGGGTAIGRRDGLELAALTLAAVLVGAAIVAEGSVARVTNGLGGLLWLVAAVMIGRSAVRTERWRIGSVVALAVVVVLAVAVRPRELAPAAIGFAIGGAAVAATGRERPLTWALLVPAAWLPAHLLINVGRSALVGATRIRTDPPPTAALVPLVMVVAAVGGGLIVEALRKRTMVGGRATAGVSGD